MNTGLFSTNGEQIFALFTPNRYSIEGSQKWFLSSFYKESSHDIPPEARNHLPAYVDYFANCPDEMYFDPKLKLLTNFDHILEENFDRLPESIKAFPKDLILTLFNGATLFLQKKISRNNRLVVPQYYNKRIMYLAPLKIGKDIIPLAIEKNIDTYRVNTIFTRGMAYCNARLLMKPESNWLINEQE